jgi:hypothetical protein
MWRIQTGLLPRQIHSMGESFVSGARQALVQTANFAAEHARATPLFKNRTGALRASIKRIDVSAGESKGWRFPIELVHAVRDEVIWYALGDMGRTREILESVSNIGPKRSVGRGNVDRWIVESIEPWEGFPVLRDGVPLRPLPLDWPGITCQRRGFAVLKPPYFERWREEECAAW